MTGNVTGYSGRKFSSVKGGRSVVDQTHLQGRLTNGAVIENPPAVGDVIFEGDICEYNYLTKKAKCLRVFKLAADVTSASTKVSFERGEYLHKLQTGYTVLPALSGLNDSGLYVTVGAITNETLSGGIKASSFTITAGALGSETIPKGTLFVVGNPIGSIEGFSITAAGTGYEVGDLITVTLSGASGGIFEVTGVTSPAGAITSVKQVSKGIGYTVSGTARATTTNSTAGADATVTISAVGAQMVVKNPNAVFTTDIPIVETAATSDSDFDGAVYYAPLFNVCTLIGAKASPIPDVVKANLRKGYSDIKIFE